MARRKIEKTATKAGPAGVRFVRRDDHVVELAPAVERERDVNDDHFELRDLLAAIRRHAPDAGDPAELAESLGETLLKIGRVLRAGVASAQERMRLESHARAAFRGFAHEVRGVDAANAMSARLLDAARQARKSGDPKTAAAWTVATLRYSWPDVARMLAERLPEVEALLAACAAERREDAVFERLAAFEGSTRLAGRTGRRLRNALTERRPPEARRTIRRRHEA